MVANLATPTEIVWDTTKPAGDRIRLMDTARASNHGFAPEVSLAKGIAETMAWYAENGDLADKRYNAFTEDNLRPDD